MTTVAIYTRLSHDKTGEQTATHRQRKACVSYAELRGWTVVKIFEDVDLSAYKSGVVRPDYEEMLRLIKAKHIDGIVAWKLDRLVRRSAEFERLWSTCDSSGVFLTSVMEPIDTSTDMGLALVRVLVAFASLESATSGVRLRAKFRERAELGRPHKNTPVFGYTEGWKKLVPREAALIREAVDRLLAGETTSAIAADWNRRGVKSATGRQWRLSALRQLLMASRNAGLRSLHGEVIGPGNWPAIITQDEYRRVVEILSDPRRLSVTTPPRYLLKGRVRCGKCGKRLVRFMQPKARVLHYQCPGPPAGCAGVSIRERFLLPWVTDQLLERLVQTRYGGISPTRWQGVPDYVVDGTIQDYAEALKRLARNYFVDRQITRDQYEEARESLYALTERRFNEDSGAAYRIKELRAVSTRNEMRLRWEALTLEEQQTVLASQIVTVTVHERNHRGAIFDPSRIEITWVGDIPDTELSAAWLGATEVGTRCGVSRQTIGRWAKEGQLHAETVGRVMLFRRSQVDAFMARRDSIRRAEAEVVTRPPEMPPHYLTTHDAAERPGVSVRTLRRRAEEGLIRAEWFSGHILGYHRGDIDRLREIGKALRR